MGRASSSVRRRLDDGRQGAVHLARFGLVHQRRVASNGTRELQGGKYPNGFAADH
jgi:hypothetical protein